MDPLQPSKKPGVVAHAYNPGFEEVETGRSQEFSDQHVSLNPWTSGSVRNQVLKCIKDQEREDNIQYRPHIHRHEHEVLHMFIQHKLIYTIHVQKFKR